MNARSLKDHLVWAVLSKADAEGRSKWCGWKKSPCEVFKSVNYTSHFNIIRDYLLSFLINIPFLIWEALKVSLGAE